MLTTPPASMARFVDATLGMAFADQPFHPSWNVPPTRSIPGLLDAPNGSGRVLSQFRWGLLPHWAKDLSFSSRTINARVETVAEKASYRAAFTTRHLIIPVDGYYEWTTRGPELKQPHLITRTDDQPLLLAGLWEEWHDPNQPDNGVVRSATILTREANADVLHLHDRMPVVIEPDAIDLWLTSLGEGARPALDRLLSAPLGVLRHRPVDRAIGSVRNDGPHLIQPVG
jgi:putative SOS response-associated peptidase YedK